MSMVHMFVGKCSTSSCFYAILSTDSSFLVLEVEFHEVFGPCCRLCH